MKRTLYLLVFLAISSFLVLFIYNRYKSKKIEQIIGANQFRLEEYLHYPNNNVKLDTIAFSNVDKEIREILQQKGAKTTKPVLRYTLKGSIRDQIFWLFDNGDGYYVIEAIDRNK